MAKNVFAIFGILTVLLMTLGMVSAAAYTTTDNNVTLSIYENALTNVSAGNTHAFIATIENLNASDYFVVFGTTDWTWIGDSKNITSSSSENFTGILTIPSSKPSSKSVIAKFYETTNTSNLLFQLSKSISLSYLASSISGCTNSSATNYNPSATVDDGSCTYTPISTFNFCEYGKKGTLEISDFEMSNFGNGDDDEWDLLDKIEFLVEVENTDSDDDVNDVMVEIMILDENGNDVTKDFDLDDEKIDLGRIKEDSVEEALFIIPEVPADMEDGDYRVYIKAYSDGDEDLQCVAESDAFDNDDSDYYVKASVDSSYSSAVVVKKDLAPISASCGEKSVELTFDVYNLGSSKEDKVLVNLYDKELGINEYEVIDGLRAGKRKSVTFTFNVPEELSQSKYNLDIYTYFDYDSDMDETDVLAYGENSYEDLEEDYYVRLDILGCKSPAPSISASLSSEARVGEELVITSSITNNGDENDFVISLSGLEGWADLISITPQTLSVDKDGSGNVIIKLMPTKEGFQSFKVNALVDGENYDRSVSVNISGKEGLFAGINNTILYTGIGIVVLLVLIFLTLIIRVSRRSAKVSQF